jgi:hypothetical protein
MLEGSGGRSQEVGSLVAQLNFSTAGMVREVPYVFRRTSRGAGTFKVAGISLNKASPAMVHGGNSG